MYPDNAEVGGAGDVEGGLRRIVVIIEQEEFVVYRVG